jgi:hypothetical protein
LKDECISWTTDGWQSKAVEGYIGATGHWLSEDFVMNHGVLGLRSTEKGTTAADVAKYLADIFEELLIQDCAWHGTTDGGGNYINAVVDELKKDHSRCFDHLLQNIVVIDSLSLHSIPRVAKLLFGLYYSHALFLSSSYRRERSRQTSLCSTK